MIVNPYAFATGGVPQAISLLAGIEAWWDFEENDTGTQWLDATGNGHHLDLLNSQTTAAMSTASGIVGRAANWPNANSANGAQLPRSDTACDGGNFSFTFGQWVTFNEMPSNDLTRFLAGRQYGTSFAAGALPWVLSLNTASGDQKFLFTTTRADQTGGISMSHAASKPLTTATAYFIVIAFDQPNLAMKMWVNAGTLEQTSAAGGVFGGGTANFSLAQGRNNDTTNYGTDKTVGHKGDSAFFLPRLITENEISYLYNSGSGKSWADIVADAAG